MGNNRAINTNSSLQKEQSRSSMTMETMQRTSYIRHQYSEQRVSSMSMSRNATRNQILPPPKQVEPDPKKEAELMALLKLIPCLNELTGKATEVKALGKGL